MGLSFAIVAGRRQRGNSRVRVPRDLLPHFTFSDSRLPQPGGQVSGIYIPQEQGGPVIHPGTGFPFRRLLRLAMVEVFELASTWGCVNSLFQTVPVVTSRHGLRRKHGLQQFLYCSMLNRCSGNVFSEPFPSKGSGIFAFSRGRCIVTTLHATLCFEDLTASFQKSKLSGVSLPLP
jgi:hypothetical protein